MATGRAEQAAILRDAPQRCGAPQSLTHNNAREIGGSDALACGGKGFQPAQSPRLIESSQASTAGRLAGALRFKPLKRLASIFRSGSQDEVHGVRFLWWIAAHD